MTQGRHGDAREAVRAIARTMPPEGMTTAQVVALLPQHHPQTVRTALSKLASWGHLDREYRRADASGMHRKWCIYKPKMMLESR